MKNCFNPCFHPRDDAAEIDERSIAFTEIQQDTGDYGLNAYRAALNILSNPPEEDDDTEEATVEKLAKDIANRITGVEDQSIEGIIDELPEETDTNAS